MSSQQIQSSKLKVTNRTYKPLTQKSLAPRPLASRPLAPRLLAQRPLAPRPLTQVTTPLVATAPLVTAPLATTSLTFSNFSDEMEVNSNFFIKYGTEDSTLMIPETNKEYDYSLQENNQEIIYVHDGDDNVNAEDLMVSIKSL